MVYLSPEMIGETGVERVSAKAAVGLAIALAVAFAIACWRLNVVSKELAAARDKAETTESLRAEITALKGEVQHYRSKQIVNEVAEEAAAKAPIQGTLSGAAAAVVVRIEKAEGNLNEMFEAAASAGSLEPAAREEVIRWLKGSVNQGGVPSMFLIARMQASAGDMDDAVQWMVTGNVMAAVDIGRYEDSSRMTTALRLVQERLHDVSGHARDRRDLQRSCIRAALDSEQQFSKRRAPRWLEEEAVRTDGGALVFALVKDGEWQSKRLAMRAAYLRWTGSDTDEKVGTRRP